MSGMITSFNKNSQAFSFAKNKNISVAAFLQNDSLETQFHLPLRIGFPGISPTTTNYPTSSSFRE
jgi:hypothetical protein